MSDHTPFNITTEAGKALWRKVNATSGSSTWGPLGESIEAIETEAKAQAWEEGYAQGSVDSYGNRLDADNPYLTGGKE